MMDRCAFLGALGILGGWFAEAQETGRRQQKRMLKRLQLLKEIVPRLSRVAVLHAVGDANVPHAIRSIETAAPSLDARVQRVGVHNPGDLPPAFSTMRAQGAHGLVVVAGSCTFANGGRIAELAIYNYLPSSYAFRETVAAGGLLSLGPNYVDMANQGAGYVAKIMNGANPANLPVEQPTMFDMVINLKTAKAFGLTIPPSLLQRADQVIE